MAKLINTAIKNYNYYLYENVDHRSDDWFLMASPWPAVYIVISYVYFVKHRGPQWMKNRPPFNLDKLLMAYNLFQIIACAYIVERALSLGWGWGHNTKWLCEPVNYSTDEIGMQMLRTSYLCLLLKISDCLDTIFFVLRKKQSQVTFLHVYHHAAMVIFSWIGVRYLPGGHGSFAFALNCFVHMWMYFYYFVTSNWPEYKQNLWWKKHITQLQMVQFGLVFCHTLPTFFIKDCSFPKLAAVLLCAQSSIFFLLFLDFYRKAYGKEKAN